MPILTRLDCELLLAYLRRIQPRGEAEELQLLRLTTLLEEATGPNQGRDQ